MKICLGYPLLARARKMNCSFLVVSGEHDCHECTEEEQKRIFGGKQGLRSEGWGDLECVIEVIK